MFASVTLMEHVLRGAVGIGALWCAVAIAEIHPRASLALGALVLRLPDLLDHRSVRNRNAACFATPSVGFGLAE